MRQIVIVGGGFAGVWAALAASNARRMYGGLRDVGITVVSRDPWLTIRPRLYEETLDDVRVQLDDVLGPSEVERIEGDVSGIDSNAGAITIGRGGTAQVLSYDRLVLAAGSRTHRPPILGADLALTVDSYADAARLQSHLDELVAAPRADGHFTAVVVGAGFTGIEVATALATRMRAAATLARSNDPSRIVVVERAPSVAPDLGPEARRWVERAVAYADGGGKFAAARRPILGAERVARFVASLVAKWQASGDVGVAPVNGGVGLLFHVAGELRAVLTVAADDERQVTGVFIVVNPEKLRMQS
jgi:NADH dehydrogenase